MENKVKGTNEMFESIIGIVGIAVTIVSIIVTCISIVQSEKKHRHQKSNRPTKE